MPARLKLAAQGAAVVVVVALGAVLGWRLTHQASAPKVGTLAPAFSLQRLDGSGKVSLGSLRGKTVVLNFWASWCDPCKREAPALERFWRAHRDENVVVLGVDSNDAASDAQRFVDAHGITYPIVRDPHGLVAANRYDIAALPVTYVLDSRGRVVGGRILGPVSDKAYAQTFARDVAAAQSS